ncbi:MAG: hypothetical protein OXT49_11295 [Gammaproteobacteria bacterium]|nr:hypothetical protein [Gammaproteobacteria bacterium]
MSSQSFGSTNLWDIWLYVGIATVIWIAAYHAQPNLSKTQILLWAAAFRLAGLSAIPPLEDDFYRFLWDGYVSVSGQSPYALPPAAFFGVENLSAKLETVLDGINHPAIATVYGPVVQAVFALAYAIAPAELWALKLLLVLVELGLFVALAKHLSASKLLLLSWCPLMVFSTAFSAHTEIIGISLAVWAYLLAKQQKPIYAAAVLALAAGAKLFALILLPWILGQTWKSRFQAAPVFGIVIGLQALPFALLTSTITGGIAAWITEGLVAMGQHWQFNSPAILTLTQLVGFTAAKTLALLVFLSWVAWQWRKPEPLPPAHQLFGLMLICSPVINPWYWCWLLPFAALQKSPWPWVGSVTMFLSYATSQNLGLDAQLGHYIPSWILLLEFGAIALALCWGRYPKHLHPNRT